MKTCKTCEKPLEIGRIITKDGDFCSIECIRNYQETDTIDKKDTWYSIADLYKELKDLKKRVDELENKD